MPDSGIIVLDASLDYESVESYTLTVRASNKKAGVPRVTIPIPVVQVRTPVRLKPVHNMFRSSPRYRASNR